jgi:hypothetical protein
VSTEDEPPPPPPPPDAGNGEVDAMPAYEPGPPTPSLPYDAAAMPPPPPMPPDEPPLVPYDASLADAVGAPSAAALRRKARDEHRGDDDPDLPQRRSRRTMAIIAASIFGGISIAALALLGHANGERYLITCDSSKATPEEGRGFPPWGTHAMAGPEWKAVTLPPNAECKPRETDDADQLAGWYLDILIDQASTTLSAKNPLEIAGPDAKTSSLDVASAQLNQALLLARAPDKRDQRKEIERLLGDIDYWHASVRLRDASATLLDAAKQFETAAAKRPRHVTDAAAWATFLHRLADQLHGGPNAPVTTATTAAGPMIAPATTAAPMGSALPVEPDQVGSADAPPPAPPVAAGGVLL